MLEYISSVANIMAVSRKCAKMSKNFNMFGGKKWLRIGISLL
jgi:hypothetical protein